MGKETDLVRMGKNNVLRQQREMRVRRLERRNLVPERIFGAFHRHRRSIVVVVSVDHAD